MPETKPGSSAAKRIAATSVFLVLCCASAHGVDAANYCIRGEFAIGCRSEQQLDELLAKIDNVKAFDKTLMADIHAGACERFNDGEPVEVVEQAPTSHHRKIRRPGASDTFWMPASYSKPIAECRAKAAGTDRHSKLQPNVRAAVKGAKAEAGGCVFKPVMTDEEIAACRSEKP